MCGITGIYSPSAPLGGEARSLIGLMNRSLSHRGPDDEGFWEDASAGIYLGHRRLSILDLSPEGHQPMVADDGCAIVFNGEIYNYREIRAGLAGPPFRSTGDTEVLLRLLQQEGRSGLHRLNGMFAFAAWDPARRELLLARDRLGIKPLYYTRQGGMFAFASEIRALLLLPWVRRELDEEALHHFLTFNSVPSPRTLLKDIRKLDPGHLMVLGEQGISRYEPYWQIGYGTPLPEGEQAVASGLLDHLRRSVRSQMVSDVPVGAFLSGGVDSSAIVALMSEVSDRPVRTFSIGFSDFLKYDERRFAADVARRFGTEHMERIVTREELVGLLPQVAEISVDPVADPTMIPIYFLAQLARQTDTKVILTGDGSDELLCGYRGWLRYAQLERYFRAWSYMPRPMRRIGGTFGRWFMRDGTAMREFLTRSAAGHEFFWAGAGGFRESVKRTITSKAYRQRTAHLDVHAYVARRRRYFRSMAPADRATNLVDWMVYSGLTDPVPNLFLQRADRLGMAHGVEIRVPFLDNDVVDYGLAIPSGLKLAQGEPKHVLKRALEPLLPREVLYRSKQGFNVPLKEWMLGIIVDEIDARLPRFCREMDLFDEQGIREIVADARRGAGYLAPSLWNIFFLMNWCDQWLFRKPGTA